MSPKRSIIDEEATPRPVITPREHPYRRLKVLPHPLLFVPRGRRRHDEHSEADALINAAGCGDNAGTEDALNDRWRRFPLDDFRASQGPSLGCRSLVWATTRFLSTQRLVWLFGSSVELITRTPTYE